MNKFKNKFFARKKSGFLPPSNYSVDLEPHNDCQLLLFLFYVPPFPAPVTFSFLRSSASCWFSHYPKIFLNVTYILWRLWIEKKKIIKEISFIRILSENYKVPVADTWKKFEYKLLLTRVFLAVFLLSWLYFVVDSCVKFTNELRRMYRELSINT